MKLSYIFAALSAVTSVLALPTLLEKRDNSTEPKKTILLSNDDGWQSTNIRAAYRELSDAGYDVIMVAPVSQRSGFGGQFKFPQTVNLTTDGEFGYPRAGAPSWAHEEDDVNIWYFNGTPAACVAFALDYLLPKYYNNKTIDLVVAGPNEGGNVSPGLFTLSGTMGATYTAVDRGLPAIAFSGYDLNYTFFKDFVGKENDEFFGPNINARLVVEFVNKLFASQKNNPLPFTTGLNVNFPDVGKECYDPEWVFTRMAGPYSDNAALKYNETTGLFKWNDIDLPATDECIFGDCDLPSEGAIIFKTKCKSSVSIFSIDFDASYQQANNFQKSFGDFFS